MAKKTKKKNIVKRVILVAVALVVVLFIIGKLTAIKNTTVTTGDTPTATDSKSQRVVPTFDVYKNNTLVAKIQPQPGYLTSTAMLPPGAPLKKHPFITASALVPEEENNLYQLLERAKDFNEYVSLLKENDYVVSLTHTPYPTPSVAASDASRLFDFVEHLNNFPTLTAEALSKILRVTFTETEADNPYFVVMEAKGNNIAGFFTSVELRTPNETNKGGLLILELRNNLNIAESDVLKRYPKAIPELTEATAPLTVPYDWKVNTSWGKISFQITRDGSKRVVAVIFDSID